MESIVDECGAFDSCNSSTRVQPVQNVRLHVTPVVESFQRLNPGEYVCKEVIISQKEKK